MTLENLISLFEKEVNIREDMIKPSRYEINDFMPV